MLTNKVRKIRDLLIKNDIDSILFVSSQNRFWITGFYNSSGYCYIDMSEIILFVDGRYMTVVKQTVKECNIEIVKDTFKDIQKKLKPKRIKKMAVESEYITHEFLEMLREEFVNIEIVPISTKKLRQIKYTEEVIIMEEAAKIVDTILAEILSTFQVGETEVELERKILKAFLDRGIDKSFKIVINSGLKGAMPHGKPSDKEIKLGELLTIDLGCTYKNYSTDMTRTVAIGEVSEDLEKIYNIVQEAQQKAVEAVKIGVSCSAVHKIAYDIIKSYGFEKYFLHQTGHGVGIETHESPRIASYDNQLLEEGMVVTIEPGIYIEGLGGVRIEDMVLVTKSGPKLLTRLDRNLLNILEKKLNII